MADTLLESLLSLYFYIGIGVLLGRIFAKYRPQVNKVLTNVLLMIISPIQIFLTLVTTTFQLNFVFVIQIVLLSFGHFGFLTATTYLVMRKKEIPKPKLGSYLLLNAMPNVMFYTIPIVISVFSDDLVIIVVLFASTMLVLRGSVATYFCQRLGADVKPNLKQSIVSLFKFPPFDAILVGSLILSFNIPLPMEFLTVIKTPVNTLASDAGAIIIGMILASLTWIEMKNYRKDIQTVAIWRFGFALAYYMIFAYLLSFAQFQTEIRTILLIINMGPPAVFNVVFAVYFHLEEKFAAIAVATVTLIALIVLPGLIYLGMLIF